MKLVLILEDIRSAHNVGSIFRTAEAAGVERIILTGLTPRPSVTPDERPAYIADRANKLIAKTALGAEKSVSWSYKPLAASALAQLRADGYTIAALELHPDAHNIFDYHPPAMLALVLGHETGGVSATSVTAADIILQIPMAGRKESLNVSVAAGIAIYQFLFNK